MNAVVVLVDSPPVVLPEGAVIGPNLRALGAALLRGHSRPAVVVAPVVVGLHVGLTARTHVLRLAGKLRWRKGKRYPVREGEEVNNFKFNTEGGKCHLHHQSTVTTGSSLSE